MLRLPCVSAFLRTLDACHQELSLSNSLLFAVEEPEHGSPAISTALERHLQTNRTVSDLRRFRKLIHHHVNPQITS
jgi:hypothetical protein